MLEVYPWWPYYPVVYGHSPAPWVHHVQHRAGHGAGYGGTGIGVHSDMLPGSQREEVVVSGQPLGGRKPDILDKTEETAGSGRINRE